MLKIVLTGGDGLVGSRIIELLNQDFSFFPISQTEMDITDKDKVNSILKSVDFDIFLHLAAYTNVVQAEKANKLAYKINAEGTKNVFETVRARNKKFIYISTDFVFDGKNPPYFEDSIPNPISVYASSKFEGEKIVNKDAMIVRISYPYRAKFDIKKDFFRTFKSSLEQKKPLAMITDSLMTPTFIDDIAYSFKYLFNNYSSEVFHLVGDKSLSPYESALLIAEKFNLDKSLIGKTTYEKYIKGKALSPKLAEIKSVKNNFHKMKTFEEGLDEIIKEI